MKGELVRMSCGHYMRPRGRKGELERRTGTKLKCSVCGRVGYGTWAGLREWWTSDDYRQRVEPKTKEAQPA